VATLLVDAFVVEALETAKLEVVPQRVVIVARTEFRIFEKILLPARFPVTEMFWAVEEPREEEAEVRLEV
jgi:hypothetical protein